MPITNYYHILFLVTFTSCHKTQIKFCNKRYLAENSAITTYFLLLYLIHNEIIWALRKSELPQFEEEILFFYWNRADPLLALPYLFYLTIFFLFFSRLPEKNSIEWSREIQIRANTKSTKNQYQDNSSGTKIKTFFKNLKQKQKGEKELTAPVKVGAWDERKRN